MSIKKRKGVIKISDELLKDDFYLLASSVMFAKFIPIYIDRNFYGVKYSGYSLEFDEVEEGCIPPEYDALITSHKDGSFTCEFKKLN